MGADLDEKDLEDICLAYLTCPQDGARAYLGALLLTDGRTRPLHFGYVAPVRPTTMQRILYGKTLDPHIKVDVITKKLATDGMDLVPDAVFVDSQDLLQARRIFGVPTAILSRMPNHVGSEGVQISAYVYRTGGEGSDEDVIGQIVSRLEHSVDLLNPFERVQEALREAVKEPSGRTS